MHADAVRVACAHNNLGLAKAVASAAPDEDLALGEGESGQGMAGAAVSPSSTRRRLWLAIARHVVQQQVCVCVRVHVLVYVCVCALRSCKGAGPPCGPSSLSCALLWCQHPARPHLCCMQGSEAEGPGHELEQTGAIKQAVDLVKEAGGQAHVAGLVRTHIHTHIHACMHAYAHPQLALHKVACWVEQFGATSHTLAQ